VAGGQQDAPKHMVGIDSPLAIMVWQVFSVMSGVQMHLERALSLADSRGLFNCFIRVLIEVVGTNEWGYLCKRSWISVGVSLIVRS
jgi:hypothetical protein